MQPCHAAHALESADSIQHPAVYEPSVMLTLATYRAAACDACVRSARVISANRVRTARAGAIEVTPHTRSVLAGHSWPFSAHVARTNHAVAWLGTACNVLHSWRISCNCLPMRLRDVPWLHASAGAGTD
jgi:hypothetical protein